MRTDLKIGDIVERDGMKFELVSVQPGVTVYREVCSREKVIQNLRHFYDVVNRIAARMERDGIDTSRFFYNTPEELQAAVDAGEIKPI